MKTRRFFAGNTLPQALMAAARYHGLSPEELAYRLRDKRHGFVTRIRRFIVEVDPAAPLRLRGESRPARADAPAAAPVTAPVTASTAWRGSGKHGGHCSWRIRGSRQRVCANAASGRLPPGPPGSARPPAAGSVGAVCSGTGPRSGHSGALSATGRGVGAGSGRSHGPPAGARRPRSRG